MDIEAFPHVSSRGSAPLSFLQEMVNWAKTVDNIIFQPNKYADIYAKVIVELGPFKSPIHRKAVMLEVMRVLAGFESSWDWEEGVDTSRLGDDTPENAETGAWQVSFNARLLHPAVQAIVRAKRITTGVVFQQTTKFNHKFAMDVVATLMRYNTKHNGPLYKGRERAAIRRSLRGEEHSIYPWLSLEAVAEFEAALR